MFLLKELFVLSTILILASLGLLEISNPYWNNSAQVRTETSSEEQVYTSKDKNEFSNDFLHYRDLIQNKIVEISEVQSEIKNLKSEFERTYLLALLKKREGDFVDAFDQLYSILPQSPKSFNYYDDLSLLGKISENLDKLSQWLIQNKLETDNLFYLYLEAVVEIQKGNSSEALKKFISLTEKGFVSKELFFQFANAYRTTGNYDDAFLKLIESEKMCIDDESFLAKIINLKGTLYFLSGDYDQAKKEYESSLDLAKKSGNKVEEIKAIANLAIIKDQYGDVYNARDDFNDAIKMAEEIENQELLAFLFSELGVSFTYTNNLVEARENYEKSFALYEMMKNNERLSYLSSNIGSLFLQISNYKSALTYYTKGLNYSGENKLGQILNLTGLADVYSNESNYSKALEYYKRAKKIADEINNVSSSVKIDQGIGALFFNSNRPLNSLDILLNTESRIDESKIPFEAIKLYSMIGTVLTSIDSFYLAESYLNKGITLADQVGDIYSSILLKTELAHNYYNQKKYSSALSLLTELQIVTKAYELSQVLGLQELYLGKIFLAEKKVEKAEIKFLSAFQLSESTADFNTQIEAGYFAAKIYEQNNKTDKAEKWYLTVIDLIERISIPLSLNQEIQIGHFSGFNDIYNSLTEFYLNQNRGEEAFAVIEKSRSRNTKINLDKLILLSQLTDESNYNQLIDLEWMISSGLYGQSESDSLHQLLSSIKNQLGQSDKKMLQSLEKNYSISLYDMQRKLQDDEYLLSFYINKSFITFFNLNTSGLSFETIHFSRDSLLSMLGAISPIYKSGLESEEFYINEDLFSFNAYASFKMYKTVFKKFLEKIPVNSSLIISLPPELVKFPMEMLVTGWDEGESPYVYKDKKFLLDDYEISYTPSAPVYLALKENSQENNQQQNLLVGDPFISNSEFALSVRGGLIEINNSQTRNINFYPLEYSEDEIKSIQGTLENNLILLSKDATESNFKLNAPTSNIVHISSHSFLMKDQPLVLFSPQQDEVDDGFLELGEIVQLNLNAELVVLSSCRSGLGKIDASEGIIGMQKAFFEAGSKSVIVTLWDVNDKYTSYFMKDFYKHLADNKSKSEALRQAKLDFIKNYSANPYYWSAYVLSGNASSIKMLDATSNQLKYYIILIIILGLIYILYIKKLKYKF